MTLSSSLEPLELRPVQRLMEPFARFAQLETASSLVLLAATCFALTLGNTRLSFQYQHVLSMHFGLVTGRTTLTLPLVEWVNDVLMAVFFLVVSLEVKRELLVGELASLQSAALPVIAAAGDMIVPACIYYSLNHGNAFRRGWGVPVATDIAFSLAILNALGTRVPLALRVFLASLAIVDDLGGILVIAVAYTSALHLFWLLLTALLLCFGVMLNLLERHNCLCICCWAPACG